MNPDILSIIMSFLPYKEYSRSKRVCKIYSETPDILMTQLTLHKNKSLDQYIHLNSLDLHNCNLDVYKKYNNIKKVKLYDCKYTGKLIDIFPNLERVEIYGYSYVEFHDIHTLKELKVLHIDSNNQSICIESIILNNNKLEYIFCNIPMLCDYYFYITNPNSNLKCIVISLNSNLLISTQFNYLYIRNNKQYYSSPSINITEYFMSNYGLNPVF